MYGKLIKPELDELLQSRNFSTIKELFEDMHPSEIAEILQDIEGTDRLVLFRLLPQDVSADTFTYFESDEQHDLLKLMGKEEAAHILNDMFADDRTKLLEDLPPNVVRELISQLSPQEKLIALTLLNYPEDSVGRLMTSEYLAIKEDMSVLEVLQFIRENGKDSETLNMIYVIGDDGTLIDDIRIRDLLLSPLNSTIKDLRDEQFAALEVNQPQEEAVSVFKKYDRFALPVIDSNGKLVGIVTSDDVLDVAEEEATEDIQKLGGMEALEYPYLATPLFEMVRKRGGWLIILFFSEMLTATALGFFESKIEKAVVLALFLPLIISSGGNSGSQAASLMVRALAVGDVNLRDWWIVFRKELLTGVFLGAILGSIGFLRIVIWSKFTNMYGANPILLGLTIGFSLVGVVLWGTMSGSMLPFVMKKLGFDPAASSAPFVATLVDVTGIVIYFTVASALLAGTYL
ncbi:MAG: magnesium transporter [Candidatus Kapabacteria bacterium]|nr:magnesium transporter [Candidatus Kapabacteria bacterium]